jgi:regulator of protease activity HflC (stomatin/prohibitin superfamily)
MRRDDPLCSNEKWVPPRIPLPLQISEHGNAVGGSGLERALDLVEGRGDRLPPRRAMKVRKEGIDYSMAAVDGMRFWILVSGVILLAFALGTVRVIPEYERALVVRFGRVIRVGGPGLLAALPLVDRVVRIRVRNSRIDSVVVRATTRDNVTVWISVAAYFRVFDPVRAYVVVPNIYTRTAETIEFVIRAEIARTNLEDLARGSTHRRDELLNKINSIVAEWGTEVRHIEFERIDLQLSVELLQWAERLARSQGRLPQQRAA